MRVARKPHAEYRYLLPFLLVQLLFVFTLIIIFLLYFPSDQPLNLVMANDTSNFEYFRYNPSLPAAVIFTVLFLLTSILHIFQLVRTRTWYFTPLVVGCLMECLGYIGRIWCSRQSPNWTLGAYIFQSLFLLVAPALFAASIYMILRRIIVAVDGEKHSLIKEKWLTKIFVASDIASFLILSSGMCNSILLCLVFHMKVFPIHHN